MPFGLQGAPSTFQRMMDSLLVGMQDFAAAYLDDLVIFSRSWPEHMLHLRRVLQKLRKADLTVNKVSTSDVTMLIPWSCGRGGARAA